MVRALEKEWESYRSRLFHFKGMHDSAGRHAKSLSIESASKLHSAADEEEEVASSGHNGQRTPSDSCLKPNSNCPRSRLGKDEAAQLVACQAREKQLLQDMEQMKERFAKLLLGEDMSGGGKGVSSALALSNAFTNLAASMFGEQKRLEPIPPERKARWRKEIDWLLSVTDCIVEFSPTQHKQKDGSNMEIMTTRQRTDLHMNVPALKKLDAMLIDCLENFKGQNEFYYVSKDSPGSKSGEGSTRKDDKWWLPTVIVPPEGLSEATRRFLQFQKDCVNQVLKAAMSINAQVLSEMEIPESYMETLPKNGRASLGDAIYRGITVEFFDPDQFLSTMDLSSEHKILDLKNRIEASIVIWKRKMNNKDGKSAWGSAVSIEKRELFEERAETILLLIKQRFPGIAQSALDISKIQYNRDVGQAVLESYSRILESLAYTVLSRIEDVLNADEVTLGQCNMLCRRSISQESEKLKEEGGAETPTSKTLFDFMGWDADQGRDLKKDFSDDLVKEKLPKVMTRRSSYLETLGGVRSPTARH